MTSYLPFLITKTLCLNTTTDCTALIRKLDSTNIIIEIGLSYSTLDVSVIGGLLSYLSGVLTRTLRPNASTDCAVLMQKFYGNNIIY